MEFAGRTSCQLCASWGDEYGSGLVVRCGGCGLCNYDFSHGGCCGFGGGSWARAWCCTSCSPGGVPQGMYLLLSDQPSPPLSSSSTTSSSSIPSSPPSVGEGRQGEGHHRGVPQQAPEPRPSKFPQWQGQPARTWTFESSSSARASIIKYATGSVGQSLRQSSWIWRSRWRPGSWGGSLEG